MKLFLVLPGTLLGGEELLVGFRDKTEAYILTTIKLFSQQSGRI